MPRGPVRALAEDETTAETPPEFDRVTPIALAMLARPPRAERGGREPAGHAPRGERLLKYLASTRRLVVGAHLAVPYEALELVHADITTLTYKGLALQVERVHLGDNQEARDAQNEPVRCRVIEAGARDA